MIRIPRRQFHIIDLLSIVDSAWRHVNALPVVVIIVLNEHSSKFHTCIFILFKNVFGLQKLYVESSNTITSWCCLEIICNAQRYATKCGWQWPAYVIQGAPRREGVDDCRLFTLKFMEYQGAFVLRKMEDKLQDILHNVHRYLMDPTTTIGSVEWRFTCNRSTTNFRTS